MVDRLGELNKNNKKEKEEYLRKVFENINADDFIKSVLNGDFNLVKDISEEEMEDKVKISFTFQNKNQEEKFLSKYVRMISELIYDEIVMSIQINPLLQENFGLEVDGDNKTISPTFFIGKNWKGFEKAKEDAIYVLKLIKRELNIN